jgi:hypothetical protein
MTKMMIPVLQEDLSRVSIGTKMKYKMYDFLKQKEILYRGGILKKIREDSIIIENKHGFKKTVPKFQMFQGKPFYKTFFYKIVDKPTHLEEENEVEVINDSEPEYTPIELINSTKVTNTISNGELNLQKLIDEQEENITSYKLKIKKLKRKINQNHKENN